jgi:SAM-dependent methyltransferase
MKIPSLLRRQVLHFECAIEDAVRDFAGQVDDRARVLDAGAGESQYARWFSRQRYIAVDSATGDADWNYSGLDAICDLAALPFAERCFDAAINIVTLEHVKEPAIALREIARTLRPGAPLLLVVPFEWEVHQQPHDYFRFTRYGIGYLLRNAGFESPVIRPAGGYFRLLSRHLFNGLRFFMCGWRWALFPLAALLLGLPAAIAPLLDGLDENKDFTVGYICTARRADAPSLKMPPR